MSSIVLCWVLALIGGITLTVLGGLLRALALECALLAPHNRGWTYVPPAPAPARWTPLAPAVALALDCGGAPDECEGRTRLAVFDALYETAPDSPGGACDAGEGRGGAVCGEGPGWVDAALARLTARADTLPPLPPRGPALPGGYAPPGAPTLEFPALARAGLEWRPVPCWRGARGRFRGLTPANDPRGPVSPALPG